jgi:hypothetical protein
MSRKKAISTLKYGGSLMLWGYFASTGSGALKVNSIMNFTQYQDVFCQKPGCLCQELIFQQDHNPKHTSKSTKKWFIGHKIILQWPA